jgi:uncharacterized protein
MKLGLLSDSHGDADIAARAIARLTSMGCDRFIHCGDVGRNVVRLLPAGRSAMVLGNNDLDPELFKRDCLNAGVEFLGQFGQLTIADKRIAVTHGDVARYLNSVIDGQQHDYLFTGHTHQKHDLRAGRLRRMNPGALHRARIKTVATLDLTTDVAAWVEVI